MTCCGSQTTTAQRGRLGRSRANGSAVPSVAETIRQRGGTRLRHPRSCLQRQPLLCQSWTPRVHGVDASRQLFPQSLRTRLPPQRRAGRAPWPQPTQSSPWSSVMSALQQHGKSGAPESSSKRRRCSNGAPRPSARLELPGRAALPVQRSTASKRHTPRQRLGGSLRRSDERLSSTSRLRPSKENRRGAPLRSPRPTRNPAETVCLPPWPPHRLLIQATPGAAGACAQAAARATRAPQASAGHAACEQRRANGRPSRSDAPGPPAHRGLG